MYFNMMSQCIFIITKKAYDQQPWTCGHSSASTFQALGLQGKSQYFLLFLWIKKKQEWKRMFQKREWEKDKKIERRERS